VSDIDINLLVKAYRRIRDAISDEKAAHEEKLAGMQADLDKVGAELLKFCNDKDLDSVKTPVGTVSRRIQTRYWTTDWEEMHKFILDREAPYLLEKRINNTAIQQYLEDNPDVLPPGLQIDRKYVIHVRKPTNR
jgi:hypothetical protein